MTPPPLVLVVDDDPLVHELVALLLRREAYDVVIAADGTEALRLFHERRPDAVVLDLGMPRRDGWETLERMRDLSDTPILLLSGSSGGIEKVRGLKAGADDYVTKPFDGQELVARVGALLRRARRDDEPERYEDGELLIDFAQRRVEVQGTEVRLTPLEFKLLAAFVRHADQVLSPVQLLQLVWNEPVYGSPHQVRLYVSYLRKKLADVGLPDAIATVRGFGYRYVTRIQTPFIRNS